MENMNVKTFVELPKVILIRGVAFGYIPKMVYGKHLGASVIFQVKHKFLVL